MSDQNGTTVEETQNESFEETENLDGDIDGDGTTDWKAEALKARGIAKRLKTKLQRIQESSTPNASQEAKSEKATAEPEKKDGFGYGELAYLETKGVDESHHNRLFKLTQETGLELRELMSRDWLKKELKEATLKAETLDATPKDTKPSSQSDKTSVDYWIAKGEYPEDRELAVKVNKARRERAQKSQKFTKRPVV